MVGSEGDETQSKVSGPVEMKRKMKGGNCLPLDQDESWARTSQAK